MKKMIEINNQEIELNKIPEREALQLILSEIVEINKNINEIIKGRSIAGKKLNK